MKYLESYRGWQIYIVPDAYYPTITGKLTSQMIDRYIAINPNTHSCIDDVSLGSIKASINEAQQ
jgi:hypothetical protein